METASAGSTALVVSLLATDEDLQRFCRRLATDANPSPMHLARVIATGTQVYPLRLDTLRDTATVLRCEFRMRNASTPLTPEIGRDLLGRLSRYELLDSFFVDARGASTGPVDQLPVAS